MNTIQDEWGSYERDVLDGAPPGQRRETRRAFYAGYMSAVLQITNVAASVTAGHMSDAAGRGIVDGLKDELARFARAVQNGQA